MKEPETFGEMVSKARKRLGLTQKQLTERIKRKDLEDTNISPQYLNDIEHDRRVPSTDVILQLASELDLNADYLHFMARKWPEDISASSVKQDQFQQLMVALRGGGKGTHR